MSLFGKCIEYRRNSPSFRPYQVPAERLADAIGYAKQRRDTLSLEHEIGA